LSTLYDFEGLDGFHVFAEDDAGKVLEQTEGLVGEEGGGVTKTQSVIVVPFLFLLFLV